MNRRLSLSALGALSMAGLAAQAVAQATDEHAAHRAATNPAAVDKPAPYAALRVAAATCISDGQACLAHCIRLLSTGDKSMADCARAVNQMLALCGAVESLAAQNSDYTPAQARLALDACNKCADACKPHVDHHAECKACHDACQTCIKECKAVAA